MTFTAKCLCDIKARVRLLPACSVFREWVIDFYIVFKIFCELCTNETTVVKVGVLYGVSKDQDVDMVLCQQVLETANFSKTSLTFYQLTWCDIPNDLNLHKQCLTVQLYLVAL
jgi:hypothetical protein